MVHACDPSALEAEAGECYFQATCYLMELLVLFFDGYLLDNVCSPRFLYLKVVYII